MSEDSVRVPPGELKAFLCALFEKTGMIPRDADFSSEALVSTSLWGVDSHGVQRAPVYLTRLAEGVIKANPAVTVLSGSLGFQVLDGDNGHGAIVAREAMEKAISVAKDLHIGAVGAINSNHFGAAAVFARMATEQGMVGIAMTNVSPLLVAPGASRPSVGNNPIAIGIPTFGDFPFMLDIAFSAVAGGKILLARQQGKKIPLDWATDDLGRPTDDPAKAFAGFLLPVGGHKGLGLAYAIELLCGVLTGGAFLDDVKNMYRRPTDPSRTSHLMIAIDPAGLMEDDQLRARLADFVGRVKGTPTLDPSGEMLIPGEIEYRSERERRVSGIPVPRASLAELDDMAVRLGLESSPAHAWE